MADHCTGACCKSFPLSVSLDELLCARIDDMLGQRYHKLQWGESAKVHEMLIPLGLSTHGPDGRKYDQPEPHYSCRHFRPGSDGRGRCGNYEGRPNMCRDFPYGSACKVKGCEWDEVVYDVPLRLVCKVSASRSLPTKQQSVKEPTTETATSAK